MRGVISFAVGMAAVLMIFLAATTAVPQAIGDDGPPAWAYPVNPPDFKASVDDGTARRVPNSTIALTLTEVGDRFRAPDWHPDEHVPMPDIVAHGRKPDIVACGFCHRANGSGGIENSNIAGLPEAYFIQQMADFKSGARKSSVQNRVPTERKARLALQVSETEIVAAAAYFAAIPTRSTVMIVETDMVPKSYVSAWHLAASASGEKEPIGKRIIEVPENLEHYESRDSRARFVAYVPTGSIKKGERLAKTGGDGKTVQCSICHGPDLRGSGPIPGISGRSPSYVVRQLYDFKHGSRAGPSSPMMKQSVEKLSTDDMIVLAAYVANLAP